MLLGQGAGKAVSLFIPVLCDFTRVSSHVRKALFAHAYICIEASKRETFLEQCHETGLDARRIPRGDTFLAFVADFDGNLFEIKEAG